MKRKTYVLEMFPYPSGNIHMGHVRNYVIGDICARYHKLKGDEVIHPMGWDAFGLPAENAAIQFKTHPQDWTKSNIDNMKSQLQRLDLDLDWDRELATCNEEYYKYQQELFIDLYNAGLVYKKDALVNWDPVDQTVLANEQVIDGKGWRTGAEVEQKNLSQWFFKITHYAEELLNDLDNLTLWPEKVKVMQRNWIGKSVGAEIDFKIDNFDKKIKIFTTRPDTIYGASFVAISINHEIVLDFIEASKFQTIKDQFSGIEHEKEKIGIPLGVCCTNPITGFYRDGFCNTDQLDFGTHTVCTLITNDFLEFSKSMGNDLSTPRPEFDFPGLKEGDKWCVCANRWLEAYENGKAPMVYLRKSHQKSTSIIDIEILKKYALDLE